MKHTNLKVPTIGILLIVFVMLTGCFGNKSGSKFAVSPEELPPGVTSVIRPKPTNETLFVRWLAQDACRRYVAARLYTEALAHYDVSKGNIEEHKKLINKTKAAWKSAKDTAAVATFYAIGLSRLERTEGESLYKETAALYDFGIMKTAYAEEKEKEKKKTDYGSLNYKSKDDVMRDYTKKELKEMLDKYPEGKQLLGISNALHIDGQTACDIMNTVNPDYQSTGRTWRDHVYDTAYRSSAVLKTAGKAAGIVIVGAGTMAASAPAAVLAGGAVLLIKVVDTGLDAVNTGFIVFTGNDEKSLAKPLAVTGTADTVASIVTFDLTKPVLGDNLKEGANLIQYIQGNFKGAKDIYKVLSAGETKGVVNILKEMAKHINPEGVNNAGGVISGLLDMKGNYDTLAVTEKPTEKGETETRAGTFSSKNPTEEDKKTAAALDASLDDAKKQAEATEKEQEAAKNQSSEDYAKAAETVEKAGDADKYKENLDKLVDETYKGLEENLPGATADNGAVDKAINEAAEKESKASGVIRGDVSGEISGEESGNVSGDSVKGKTAGEVSGKEDKDRDSGEESGEAVKGQESGTEDKGQDSGKESGTEDKDPKDAPYAVEKVIGVKCSHSAYGYTTYFTLTSGGGGLVINISNPKGGLHEVAEVISYDPWTGTGMASNHGEVGTFSVTGEPGNMTLHVTE